MLNGKVTLYPEFYARMEANSRGIGDIYAGKKSNCVHVNRARMQVVMPAHIRA
jgi:hypothetical protein